MTDLLHPSGPVSSLTPYLAVHDAAAALDFYTAALAARETCRIVEGGRISHAEMKAGGATFFLSDEYPEEGALAPAPDAPNPVLLVLEVPDVDAALERAVAAGATTTRPPRDSFGGRLRTAKFVDPFGHRWMLTRQS